MVTEVEMLTRAGDYRPKVSTWGMFPRPDNISKAYGGGRTIQKGGEMVRTLNEGHPTRSRRTCTCEFGLQSCRGKSAGVAKRLISHPKPLYVTIRNLCRRVRRPDRRERTGSRRR